MIATPAYSGLTAPYVKSLFASQARLISEGIEVSFEVLSENCHVDDGRNILVRDFLESDCTELIFLDADLGWEAEDLLKLINYDRDIVAGIYPLKEKDENYPVRLIEGDVWSRDGLVEVEAVPTGFLKIRRGVLLELAKSAEKFRGKGDHNGRRDVPLIFERIMKDGARWGGDYTFCNKARAKGVKIYIDPEMEFGHFGDAEWKGRFGDFLRSQNDLPNPRLVEAINKIIDGDVSEQVFIDVFFAWGNVFAAPPALIQTCYDMALEADTVFECGSGITTLILGLTGKQVYSVEDDYQWYLKVQRYLDLFQIDNVHLYHSKLVNYGDYTWYEKQDFPQFDLALVDAPCRAIGRKGFYEVFKDRLDDVTLIVDDSETELHYVDGRDNLVVGGEERPFAISRPIKKEKAA